MFIEQVPPHLSPTGVPHQWYMQVMLMQQGRSMHKKQVLENVAHTSCRMCETFIVLGRKRCIELLATADSPLQKHWGICQGIGECFNLPTPREENLLNVPCWLHTTNWESSAVRGMKSRFEGLKKNPNRNTDTDTHKIKQPPHQKQTNKNPRKTVLQFTKTLNIIAPPLQCRCREWRNWTQLYLFVSRRKLLLWLRRNRTLS